MTFHRLTVPAYFGGLLPGYDYINNALTPATAALADVAKADGPNIGTYFVAFGEDGTSKNTNRANKALAENTDALDDIVHRDVAIPAVTADVVAGGFVSSILLPGPVFIGLPGTPNTVEGIRTFVTLVDANDDQIYAGASECQVTAIAPDVPGNTWSAGNVTLTIAPAILAGTTYRVYYSTRGSAASFAASTLVGARRTYNRYSGGPNWADATTNPATFVTTQLDKIISDLSSQAPSGAARIGFGGSGLWADGTANPATTVGLQLSKIVSDLAAISGAPKIGSAAIAGARFSSADAAIRSQLVTLFGGANALATEIVDRVDIITSNKTWTPGTGTTAVEVTAWGGGGGGGGGLAGAVTTVWCQAGGGGGGAAVARTFPVVVAPATGYACVIGGGGIAGPVGTAGGDGVDTTFGGVLTFSGAIGGACDTGNFVHPYAPTTTSLSYANVAGGVCTKGVPKRVHLANAVFYAEFGSPGKGGNGVIAAEAPGSAARTGSGSLEGYSGGTGGVGGLAGGAYAGGGPGGGGAAGPGGNGGTGGAGGDGNPAGNGVAGTAGGVVAANSGAGGGGGGSGGYGSAAGGAGAAGAAGGSGKMIIRYRGPQAAIV